MSDVAEWRTQRLGDFTVIVRGSSPRPKGDPRYYGGTVPRLMVEDVTRDGKFVVPRIDFLTEAGAALSRPLPAGTLTLVCSGTVGIPSFLAIDACIHDGFIGFRQIGETCVPDYLYHQFVFLKERLDTIATHGGIFTNLTTTIVKNFQISLPIKSEQRKIARILTTVDNLIEKTEALIAKYQAIKQGMMHDLFTRGVDEHGHLRPPYEQAPELYKQSELGWIPKEWEVCLLDEVAIRGSGHTPNKLIGAYWNGGIKWVSLADSDKLDRLFITDTDKNISELGLANSSAVRHRPGTVILSRDAGIGKSAIISEVMAVSQHFMAWFCGPRLINFFFYYWLQHEKPRFEAIAMGSTIKTIGLSFFKKLRIAVPSIAEQRFGSDAVLAVERHLIGLAEELAKYRVQKTGLMQDLLTGKVRVKVDEAELTSSTQ